MRPAKEGDRIRVGYRFSNSGLITINGEILHVPTDSGDFFWILLDDGTVSGINPSCAYLVAVDILEEDLAVPDG